MRRVRKKTGFRPQNTRLDGTNVARQHRFYAEAQKHKTRATLLASGISAIVYSYLQSGVRCTCQQRASLLDEDGNMTDDAMRKVLIGSPVAGHTQSGRVTKPVMDAADVGLAELETSYEGLRKSGFFEGLDDDSDIDDNWGGGDQDPSGGSDLVYGSMNQDRCAICFGSGFVGGFRLAGGNRVLLTTQSPLVDNMLEANINRSAGPHRFTDARRVVFDEVSLPYRAGQRLHMLRVWNNDIPLPRNCYSINRADVLRAATHGDPLTSIDVSFDDGAEFTHVEIQTFHRKVHIDINQVPDNFHPNLQGRSANATLTLPPETPVSKYSVVRESKYGRAWQVGEVNPGLNNRGVAVWFEVEARLVAQHELFHQLAGAY